MYEFLGKGELMSLALQDEEALKSAKRRTIKEKTSAEKIRDFWRKRRTNYKHRDDSFEKDWEMRRLHHKFTPCDVSSGKYVLARRSDTVTLLKVTGRNVRKCTISDVENKILEFHLIPSNKEKTFIVELPESIPIVLIPFRETFVDFDADSVTKVEQKGDFITDDKRQSFQMTKYRFKHECSTGRLIEHGWASP
ncbi:hypothetical protein ISTM_464 [Insectomime virus]|uniref:Uncharacterized protein n=1 Tax=Tunisvirus fontaine2 TaxID=1421067 RepID=V9SGN6_9VIRU|nr:hypothetical protein D1R32_gp337 [Tunisvirus fontaine2]AHA46362.1 hypothetical protein ISTM_464 [Insectomime virus]AHC55054.1 hypothetical protein TNS_ORF336 [Tunisvirus fontaine2]